MIDMAVFGLVVAVLLMPVCVLLVSMWRWRRQGDRRFVRADAASPARSTSAPPGLGVGRGAEARLVAGLFAGDLTAEQYRGAMASLAAHDAQRHPVVAPPEG
jgi:hypothetical protein